jgi:transcriptional regulator with XRE-family HTH domain
MRMSEWAQQHYNKLESDPEYLAALAMTEVNEQIVTRMETLGISQRELARRLGKAQSFVSRLLNHGTNATMVTLASIAVALDANLEAPRIIPKEPAVRVPLHAEGSVTTVPAPKAAPETREAWEEPVGTDGRASQKKDPTKLEAVA